MKKQYKNQLQTLVKVNNTHIQKEENEIAKLTGQRRKLVAELEEREKKIQDLIKERDHFKVNYFKSLPTKTFGTEQVNFFRTTLEMFESRILEARKEKQKVIQNIETVDKNLKKHREAYKKYSFKNEKYDVLKLRFSNSH